MACYIYSLENEEKEKTQWFSVSYYDLSPDFCKD